MTYNPYAWYWLASNGNIFSSASQSLVSSTDPGYVSFLASNKPAVWPQDGTGAQTDAALDAVLAPYGLATNPVTSLITYAEAKQQPVLAAMTVSFALPDGSATLTTMCDQGSITFLNSLAAWVALNGSVSPVPTRTYYNLDGSAHTVTPTDLAAFLNYAGTRVQATFDALATVRSAIAATPPTITTKSEVDAFAWPTS